MLLWMGLLEASVAGGIGIVLCFLVSLLCGGRYRARYKKIVWLLIALRLCVPVSLSVFPQLFTVQLPVYMLEERESKPVTGDDGRTNAPVGVGEMETDDHSLAISEAGQGMRVVDIPVAGEDAESNIEHQINLGDIFVGIWVCGSFIVLLYYLIGHSMFCHSMMRRSEICRNANINEAVSEMAAQLKLKRVPQVRIANKMQTGPFTIGFFRNIIVLPDADYEEENFHYVIRHELVHCAGRDAQLKVIFILVNIIHWFNPLVWFMKTLVDQDMELACDEKVLAASTEDERKEYSEVLMSYVTAGVPGKSVLFTGCAHDINFMKKRFKSIYNTHKKSGKVIGGLLVFFLMLISGLFGFEDGQTVYARENGNVSNTGIFQGMLNAFFNGDSYSSTDTDEYLQFDGFRGKSSLSILPKSIEEVEVIDYLYQYRDTLFDPTVQIYLECRYDEEAYQAEIARLQGIQVANPAENERQGEIQTNYQTENERLQEIQADLQAVIERLQGIEADYRAENERLQKVQADYRAENERLQGIQADYPAENERLQEIQADYQTEIERLQEIQAEYDGKVQTVLYDTENFAYPAYVTINGNNHCYEYALLLGEGKIAYIHLEFIKEEDVAFSADYLPKAYEEKDNGYSMYIFYQEDGSGYYAAPSEE